MSRLANITIQFAAWLLLSALMMLVGTQTTQAFELSPEPGSSAAYPRVPAQVEAHLEACDSRVPIRSPSFAHWLSLAGSPTNIEPIVTAGQASIDLDFNFASAACSDRHNVDATRRTYDPTGVVIRYNNAEQPGTVSSLSGPRSTVNFSVPVPATLGPWGFSDETSIRVAPTGGFSNPGTYTLTIPFVTINRFVNGNVHRCVQGPDNVFPTSLNDTGPCNSDNGSLNIVVRVVQPPQDPNCSFVNTASFVNEGQRHRVAARISNPNTFDINVARALVNITAPGYSSTHDTSANLPVTVQDGNNRRIRSEVITINTPGTYTYTWDMRWSGGGETGSFSCVQTVTVNPVVVAVTPPVCSVGSAQALAGQNYRINVTVTNPAGNAASIRVDGIDVSENGGPARGTSPATGNINAGNNSTFTTPSYNNSTPGIYTYSATVDWSSGADSGTINCSNGTGSIIGTLSCSINSVIDAEVGTSFRLPVTLSHSNPPAIPVTIISTSYSVTGGPTPSSGSAQGATGVLPSSPSTFESGDITSNGSGQFSYTWTIRYSTTVGGTRTTSCSGNTRIALRPYFLQFGGDVISGGGIATPSNICESSDADVLGFLRGSSFSDYRGSSVELAIFAAGQIRAVKAASQQSISPLSLSFANRITDPGSGVVVDDSGFNRAFGGGFSQRCVRDNFDHIDYDTLTDVPIGAARDLSRLGTGSYRLTTGGTQELSTGSGIELANKVVIYRRGDVYIQGNGSGVFGFANDNWQDRSQIPAFTLIVEGNIYIDNNVTQLDGVYIAQPVTEANGTKTGGEIFTCAINTTSAGSNLVSPSVNSNVLFNNCRDQLTVYGAFQAEKVHLLRSVGTTTQAQVIEPITSSQAGEVFIYPPELFLTQGGGLPSSSGAVDTQSQIALPPVF